MKLYTSMRAKVFSTCLIIFTIIIAPVKSQDQKVWTLEECIQYAIDNNISIQRQELQTKSAKINYNHSKLSVLPSVSAGLSHGLSIGRSLNIEDYSYVNTNNHAGSIFASTGMSIFRGLQNINRISQFKFNYLASLEALELAKNNVSLFIAGAYLNILLNQELLEVAKNQLEVTKQQLFRTKVFYEEGQSAKAAVLVIQAQLANEELVVTNAINLVRRVTLTLTQLLRLPSPENFIISIPDNLDIGSLAELSPVNSVYIYASQNFPQIKGAEYSMKANEKALAIARASIIPSISISAGINSRYSQYVHNNNPFFPGIEYPYIDQINDNRYQSINLSLSIPIFSRMQFRNGISNAKITAIDSKLQLDQAKQDLYQEIQQVHSQALAAFDRYISSQSAVSSTKEAFDFAEKRYEVGLIPPLEYNIQKNSLTQSESELIQAKYNYIFQMKILQFYNGQQLTLQ